jgi:hypothetical protein
MYLVQAMSKWCGTDIAARELSAILFTVLLHLQYLCLSVTSREDSNTMRIVPAAFAAVATTLIPCMPFTSVSGQHGGGPARHARRTSACYYCITPSSTRPALK